MGRRAASQFVRRCGGNRYCLARFRSCGSFRISPSLSRSEATVAIRFLLASSRVSNRVTPKGVGQLLVFQSRHCQRRPAANPSPGGKGDRRQARRMRNGETHAPKHGAPWGNGLPRQSADWLAMTVEYRYTTALANGLSPTFASLGQSSHRCEGQGCTAGTIPSGSGK